MVFSPFSCIQTGENVILKAHQRARAYCSPDNCPQDNCSRPIPPGQLPPRTTAPRGQFPPRTTTPDKFVLRFLYASLEPLHVAVIMFLIRLFVSQTGYLESSPAFGHWHCLRFQWVPIFFWGAIAGGRFFFPLYITVALMHCHYI
jgi:hypothetical protein